NWLNNPIGAGTPQPREEGDCIHGDIRPYLSAWAQLTIDGVTRRPVVGLAPRLAYPHSVEITDGDDASPGEARGPSGPADFCRDQRADPILSGAYEQLAAMDGTILDPGRA
uniref:Uncharacterized protein n=1 Tax=Gopherus agassizii TaxID=38772 RepID=A0A452GML7_9SAUR